MASLLARSRDVFIVYTKADPYESKLVEAIKDQLYKWGLSVWVYEDWEWATERKAEPLWRSYGTRLDPVRYATGHPEPFRHPQTRSEADREILAAMFEQCGAILLIAPRVVSLAPGTEVEVDILEREPHAAIASISWHKENDALTKNLGVVFDYRMPSTHPNHFDISSESAARLAWLACMMSRLDGCGFLGRDVLHQLAQGDPLLNRIAIHALRPVRVPLEPDFYRPAHLSSEATAEDCVPVIELWRGGPGLTAGQLASGKPPTEIIEASKLMRSVLEDWCAQAQKRFPALSAPNAKISLSLGEAKMRLGLLREAIDEFTSALAAPNAQPLRSEILLNRGLAKSELNLPTEAVDDYTRVFDDPALSDQLRCAALHNRAVVWKTLGLDDKAETDLNAILALPHLDPQTEALALISRAHARGKSGKPSQVIEDYDRILDLEKAPVEARLQALINRGAFHAKQASHKAAIRDYTEALGLHEIQPRQVVLALYNRGWSKAACGDAEGARADYQQALAQPGLDSAMRRKIESELNP